MFTKNHEVTIGSAWAMDLVKVLGKSGIKFEVTDEYFNVLGQEKLWYRDFTIRASKRTYVKLMNEFYANVKANK